MCEKCEELEDDGIFDREIRITLTVGEAVALLTTAEVAISMGVVKPVAPARDKLMAALAADKEAFQNGEWPDEITEVEQ